MVNVTWIALINILLWGLMIGLVVYFFNRLNKIIALIEEIKEQNRK